MFKFIFFITLTILFSSCVSLQNNAKYELSDGKYSLKIDGKKYFCYVENSPDSITIYKLPSKISTSYPDKTEMYFPTKQGLIKPGLDIDILTALFKFRPQTEGILPAQLNSGFNGNVYIGYRTDSYQIQYKKNSLDIYERKINHFGLSGGLFLGLGHTAMNPSTTNNAISSEYDGLILQKGLAGIVEVNKLIISVSIGFDSLLDENNKAWIYENKPWFGLMLGLHLN